MSIPTFAEFKNELHNMLDSNNLTDEDRKCLDNPFKEWVCKELDKIVRTKLTDAKLQDHSFMIYLINLLKIQFLTLTEEQKQEMSANSYREYSKWILGVHKILELPMIKAFNNMLNLELDRRLDAGKITEEMKEKRLEVLFRTFQAAPDLFQYLLKKFNKDDDIPIRIEFNEDNNPFVLLSTDLMDKAEEVDKENWRSLAVEFLGEDVAERLLQ
jgi:hypothetical protein